jgi:glycosyltransferase involved in cell wall biosynthesis
MRVCFVVQRYGHGVAGGAELHCRLFATHLAERGHHVEALTSCAMSYTDWANHFPEGTSVIDGVTVHRLPVARPREERLFHPMGSRVINGHKPVPHYVQAEWMRMQGPYLPGLQSWLETNATRFDVVVFFTYLYYTAWAGLPVASGLVPTVMHPTAHEEPPLHLQLYDLTFRQPNAFAFSTEEERTLVFERFHIRRLNSIIGIGFDLDATGDAARFRSAYGLGDDPYLLFVGRLDPGKGSDEVFEFFNAYKKRNPGPLKLAVVGEPVKPLPPHPEVVVTGFVDEQVKVDAYEGALALVQPSYFESFSMVLAEAWAQRLPAIVQGHCEVLVGQSRRSGGGIPYWGYAEFEAVVDKLLEDPALVQAMGAAGRRYVEANYAWDVVMERYEKLLSRATQLPRVS